MLPLLDLSALQAAPLLLGALLTRKLSDGTILQGRIVETEAYDQSDPASHSFRGPTERTEVMFGPAGFLYVYFSYGMHYCCNIVTGEKGDGQAVLIRALEPIRGTASMIENRHTDKNLTNGPAKLCQALKIDKALNGHDLALPPLTLQLQPPLPADQIVQATRIGIKQAVDKPWRFYIKDSNFVSVR